MRAIVAVTLIALASPAVPQEHDHQHSTYAAASGLWLFHSRVRLGSFQIITPASRSP